MRTASTLTVSLLLTLSLLLGAAGMPAAWGSLDVAQENNRAKLLSYVLRQQLDQHHYSHKVIDDDLSKAAFDLFLKQLDFQKRFLIAKDVDQLQPFATRIDDELTRGQIELPKIVATLLKVRINQVRQVVTDILSQELKIDGSEVLETDPEKLDWCQSQPELKERWRKILTYQVINTMLVLEDEQTDAKGPAPAEALKSLQEKAREKVAKRFDHFFERLLKDTLRDYYDRYFNAVTRAYDPHTTYLPPQQKEDFEIGMRGSLEGIGATLREEDGFIKVVRIIPGSASSRQGELEAEDIILAVAQGKEEPVDVTDTRLRDAVELIRGPKGTEVRLTVKKADSTRKVIPITRDVVEIEETFVKSMLLSDPTTGRNFGYLKIPSFYRDFSSSFMGQGGRNVTSDVAAALKDLTQQGISGLIIDLRNNGGGALKDAVNVSGLFIDKGPVVQVKSSGGDVQVLRDNDSGVAYDGPVAVLVNRFSASASEIFAAALQDYHRAYIIGSDHTYGKGTVQTILDLDRSVPLKGMDIYKPLGALKITTQKFYRVSGGSTQYKGVEADLIMPDRMRYLKSGEKYIDYSLPWDTVQATSYQPWEKVEDLQVDVLKNKSSQRVAASDKFQEIIQSSEKAKQRQEETQVTLNLETLRQEQKSNADAETDPLGFHGESDDEDSANNVKTEQDRQRLWQESVRKDPFALEAVSILGDLFPAVTAKPSLQSATSGASSAN
ncbi:MAG TPA: carboxy terminal-processing peptidase [Geothermobacteraceae bacterium]|nr:carboxy terminal-processing peptidase [Geothermobacteraceae bacterium]